MKNKILLRLILYFFTSLLIFSIAIGAIFWFLFSKHNMDTHKIDLEKRAVNIAEALSGYFETRHAMGMGINLRLIEAAAMSDVWVVDQDLKQVTFMRGEMCNLCDLYTDLPDGAEYVITEALNGNASFSEVFSPFLEMPVITVATPIIISNGTVVGALLLHSQISNINSVTQSGLLILAFSMIAAVIISVFVAWALSSHFTKPLRKMKKAAIQICSGNYFVQTGVTQSDEIGELAAVMDDMAVKLNAASKESAKLEKLRRDFIANISHELRTPITVIRGSLDALCDGVVTDPVKVEEYHKQMQAESGYLERMVSDLLDLARLQNPDFAVEKWEVDIKGIAEDAIRSIRQIAGKKHVIINFLVADNNYMTIGDYGRLRQMLMIVLDNAVKFSPDGGTVGVTLWNDGNTIHLQVKDTGCGIPAADIPFIFERFHKSHSEENKSGTGLGLAIAKQIADRHEASIAITSEPNKGTEVVFSFPKENFYKP